MSFVDTFDRCSWLDFNNVFRKSPILIIGEMSATLIPFGMGFAFYCAEKITQLSIRAFAQQMGRDPNVNDAILAPMQTLEREFGQRKWMSIGLGFTAVALFDLMHFYSGWKNGCLSDHTITAQPITSNTFNYSGTHDS